jgi:hypothetical protein
MEAFKIENFEREHGPGTFIPYRHLSKEEADHLFRSLKRRLGLPDDSDGLRAVKIVRERSTWLKNANAGSEGFDLGRLFEDLKFDVSDTVYLNWYRFDEIDELRTRDLFNTFGDLWYPSSDDLDIFDSSMDWLLSIEHSGALRAFNSTRRSLERRS